MINRNNSIRYQMALHHEHDDNDDDDDDDYKFFPSPPRALNAITHAAAHVFTSTLALVRIPQGTKQCSPLQTSSVAHRASYSMDTGDSLGVKRSGRHADHSTSSTEVTKEWSYTSASPIRLHGVATDNFNFTHIQPEIFKTPTMSI